MQAAENHLAPHAQAPLAPQAEAPLAPLAPQVQAPLAQQARQARQVQLEQPVKRDTLVHRARQELLACLVISSPLRPSATGCLIR